VPDIVIDGTIVEVKSIFRELKCKHCGTVYGRTDDVRLDLGSAYLLQLSIIYCKQCACRNRWAPEKQQGDEIRRDSLTNPAS
jgi:RNase P subunit RPR2